MAISSSILPPWKDWNDPYKPPEESAVALAQWAWQTVVDAESRERLEIGMRAGRIWVDRDAIMTAWGVGQRFGTVGRDGIVKAR